MWKRSFSDLAAQYNENEINAKCLILSSEWAKFPLTFKISSPANGIREHYLHLGHVQHYVLSLPFVSLPFEWMYRIFEISTASCE